MHAQAQMIIIKSKMANIRNVSLEVIMHFRLSKFISLEWLHFLNKSDVQLLSV